MPDDMGTKNKSLSTNDKNQKGKDDKNKKDKKGPSEKREVSVAINQNEAEKIIQNSPFAIQSALKAINSNYVDGVDGYKTEIDAFGNCFGTEEFIEGTTAFLEKRKANF